MKKFLSIAMLLCAMPLCSASAAQAFNYYVSASSGSDTYGDGSSSYPWATINRAIDSMNGSDTLKIDAGTYNEAITVPRELSGSLGAETTIEPWHEGDEVTIAYSSVLDHAVTINASYLNFKNIAIDATAPGASVTDDKHQCLRVKPAESDPYNLSNVLISGVEVYGCRSHGIQIVGDIANGVNYTASHVTVENSSIHDTNMQNEDMGDGSSWGSALKVGTDGHHITLKNNSVYDNWGEGIDIAKGYYVDILDNVSYNNLAPDIYIDNAYEINVEGNFTYCYDLEDSRAITDGARTWTSISIAEEDYAGWPNQLHDVYIVNNISYNCSKTFGIYLPERDDADVNRQNIVITHNTFYTNANTSGASISIYRHPTDDITFKNNISRGNPDLKPIYESGDFSGSAVYTNNLWVGSNPVSALQVDNISATEAEVNFAATPSADPNAFKILEGSVAIDAGADVGVTIDFEYNPRDSSPDIGAFEFASAAHAPFNADFESNILFGTEPLTVQFTNLSNYTPLVSEWDFNSDGIVDSTETNPSHTYLLAGNYTVTLTGFGGAGADELNWDTERKVFYIAVFPKPYEVEPPVVTEVTYIPSPTSDSTPDYTFNSDKAGTITYGGSCSSSTTDAVVGDNTITLNELPDGTYSDCTITVTDSSSKSSDPLTVSSFTVDTSVVDTTPDQFTFVDVINAALYNYYISNPITVSGINTSTPISISNGEYRVNGGDWLSDNYTVNLGDIIEVRLESSRKFNKSVSATLTIGGVSDQFTVTTISRKDLPPWR